MEKSKIALENYNKSKEKRKAEIKADPSRWRRFWKWVWFWMSYPFRWIWMACHDWHVLVIFLLVFMFYSASVWGFYLAGAICYPNEALRNWLWGIGTAVWVWWLGPLSPFTELVILTTMGIKAVADKINNNKKEEKNGDS